jgi:hypothetical protein
LELTPPIVPLLRASKTRLTFGATIHLHLTSLIAVLHRVQIGILDLHSFIALAFLVGVAAAIASWFLRFGMLIGLQLLIAGQVELVWWMRWHRWYRWIAIASVPKDNLLTLRDWACDCAVNVFAVHKHSQDIEHTKSGVYAVNAYVWFELFRQLDKEDANYRNALLQIYLVNRVCIDWERTVTVAALTTLGTYVCHHQAEMDGIIATRQLLSFSRISNNNKDICTHTQNAPCKHVQITIQTPCSTLPPPT